jgi:ribose-phosphate pyrophosphokinase
MSSRYKKLKIFTGNANAGLAEEIAQYLGVPVGDARSTRFCDGEINIKINESVRGADVFIIQPTCSPINENLVELLIMIDAVRRASARRITAVLPYYGYARQDRKTRARDPITAKLVANILVASGARRVLCMDLHAGQIQGFFDIPVDHLPGVPILAEYILQIGLENVVVVSPDLGGVTRARDLAERIGATIAVIDKRRLRTGGFGPKGRACQLQSRVYPRKGPGADPGSPSNVGRPGARRGLFPVVQPAGQPGPVLPPHGQPAPLHVPPQPLFAPHRQQLQRL